MRVIAWPMVRSYALCELTIEVRTTELSAEKEVAELLAAFPVASLSTTPERPDLTLSVAWTDVVAPSPFPPVSSYQCFGVTLFTEGDNCSVADDHALFKLNRRTGIGQFLLLPSFSDQGLLKKHNIFLLGLMQGLLGYGCFDLHAAGLVKEGVGYLLVGEPASGKSSAALSLACQGWGYLSDDALLLKRNSNGVEAFGFRRKFCIDPRLGEHFPAIAEQLECAVSVDQPKRFVDLEKLYPGQLHESVVPGVLIFTRIVAAPESQLLALDQTTALVRLLHQSASLSFNRHSAAQHLAVLRQLVSQTVSYELCAGRDLYEAPDKIVQILEGIESPSVMGGVTRLNTDSQTAMQQRPV